MLRPREHIGLLAAPFRSRTCWRWDHGQLSGLIPHRLTAAGDDTADSAHILSARGGDEGLVSAAELLPNVRGVNTETILSVPPEGRANQGQEQHDHDYREH
jgi:hypothetical protein